MIVGAAGSLDLHRRVGDPVVALQVPVDRPQDLGMVGPLAHPRVQGEERPLVVSVQAWTWWTSWTAGMPGLLARRLWTSGQSGVPFGRIWADLRTSRQALNKISPATAPRAAGRSASSRR